jgi:hypothetical protein
MKKRGFIIFSLLVILSLTLFANASSTDVIIFNKGCSVNIGGEDIYIAENSCDRELGYYCESHDTARDGFTDPNACLRGEIVSNPNDGDIFPNGCCPQNSDCKYDSDENAFFCKYATLDCSDIEDINECEGEYNHRCYWYNDECLTRVKGCYEYLDPDKCREDFLNISFIDRNCKAGETKSLGSFFVIKKETCKCYWNGSSCGLMYNISHVFGNNPKNAVCKFVLQKDECIDGFQNYKYMVEEFDNNSLNLLQGDANCIEEKGILRCDIPIVKVNFFNLLNTIIVILLISLFYIHKTKFKKILK